MNPKKNRYTLVLSLFVAVIAIAFISSNSWAVYGVPIINLKQAEMLERSGKYLEAAAARELAADFYEFVSIPQFADDMEYFQNIGDKDKAQFCRNTIAGFQKSMNLCRKMAEKDREKGKLTKEQIDKYRDRNRMRMLAGAEVYPVMHNGQMGVDVSALEKNGEVAEDFEKAAEGRERSARLYEKITISWVIREAEILTKNGRTKLAAEYKGKVEDYKQKVKNHRQKAIEDRQKAESLRKFGDEEYAMNALDSDDPSIRKLALRKIVRDTNYPAVLKAARSRFSDLNNMAREALEENKNLFDAVKVDTLVLALGSGDLDIRRIAIEELKNLAGTTMGYIPDGAEAARKASMAKWQEWLTRKLKNGLSGIYYKGKDFDKEMLVRVDKEINFQWNNEPHKSLPNDQFSIRWIGKIRVPKTGKYNISVDADDGAKVWIGEGADLKEIVTKWSEYSYAGSKKEVYLEAGLHDVKIEYFENNKNAKMMLYWDSEYDKKKIIPEENLYHVSLDN